MNLLIPNIDWCIDISEDCITDLVIENQTLFCDILMDLNNQINGNPGYVILSENEKMYNISKTADIIWNPIVIDVNSQKILKKLYQEMQEIFLEFEDEVAEVNSQIVGLLDLVIQKLPYNIGCSCDIDMPSLLKTYKVQFDRECASIADSFLNYLKTLHQLCSINVFFTVNLKEYFNEKDINEIYKSCVYEKIILINLSNTEKGYYSSEKRYIIDSDLCIITAD